MMALLYSHFNEPPPPLEALRPDCPDPIRAAVMRMIQKDPAARWPSLEEAIGAMGARQLAHDDPTRGQLRSLARTGLSHKIVSQVQTPRSPIPFAKRSGPTAPVSVAAVPAPRHGVGFLVAGGALAVAAIVLLFGAGFFGGSVRSTPPGEPPATVSPTPVAEAAPASLGGSSAGAIPKLEAPAETRQRPQEPTPKRPESSPAASTSVPDTRTSGLSAAGEPSPVEPAARALAAVPPPPPVPAAAATVVASPPAAAAPMAVDEKAEVGATIQAYARALEAGDLAQARRVYPGMPPDQRQGLEALWKSGGSIRPRWTVSDVVVQGDVATARVVGVNAVLTAREGASELRVSLQARLERRGPDWRLVSLGN
jgi:serine/threonine-protein kinase